MEINQIYNIDCIDGMKQLPDSYVNLYVFSPPYNVGIEYDGCDDSLSNDDYFEWTRTYFQEIYRTLKDDGRVAINIPFETNQHNRGGRTFFSAEIWRLMKEVGFGFAGVVDLDEDAPHMSKTTAWGSWLSSSAPYIYNPKECIVLGYKKQWNRINKRGQTFADKDKNRFIDLAYGIWKYKSQTQVITKVNYSLDIPINAIEILTYEDDLVVDPFMGSGQTALAALVLNRNYIGFELSTEYTKIANKRISDFIKKTKYFDLDVEGKRKVVEGIRIGIKKEKNKNNEMEVIDNKWISYET